MTKKDERIAQLQEQGANLIKDAYSEASKLTQLYKDLATVIVNLRKEFKYNGATDWDGRSQEYRDAAAAMYEKAGVPTDAVSGIQANVRYHVGVVLREKGLRKETPAKEAASTGGRGSMADSDDPEEWIRDSVTSLRSVKDDHPDLVVIDLEAESIDPVELIEAARDTLRTAAQIGVGNVNPDEAETARRLLTETVQHAGMLMAELEAFHAAPPAEPAKAKADGQGDKDGETIDVRSTVKEPTAA